MMVDYLRLHYPFLETGYLFHEEQEPQTPHILDCDKLEPALLMLDTVEMAILIFILMEV